MSTLRLSTPSPARVSLHHRVHPARLPAGEIERIATYLITEKGLNTYVKCNPTLLGYEFARRPRLAGL